MEVFGEVARGSKFPRVVLGASPGSDSSISIPSLSCLNDKLKPWSSRFLQFLFTVSCVQLSRLRRKCHLPEAQNALVRIRLRIIVVAYSLELLPHAPTDAAHSIH